MNCRFNKIYSRFVESAASVATRALAHLFVSSRDVEQGTPPAAAGGTPQPQRRAGRRSGSGRSEERPARDAPGPPGAKAAPGEAQGPTTHAGRPAAARRARPGKGHGPRHRGSRSARKVYAVKLMERYGDIERVRRNLNHSAKSVTAIYAMADVLLEQKQARRGNARAKRLASQPDEQVK